MTGGVDKIGMRRHGESPEGFGPLWKSGASAPRQGSLRSAGFRPSSLRGLKAFLLSVRNAAPSASSGQALKGPLFHVTGSAVRTLSAGLLLALFASHALAQVTFERLVNSAKEPQNWMTYSGDYTGKRFSGLEQVNITNVRALVAKSVYQTGATRKLET